MGRWEHAREAWKDSRSVPESIATAAAVAQRAPVEHQAGAVWPAIPRRGVRPPALNKCCGFLELEVDHVIGCEKALRSTLRNRELEGTTKSFCAMDGVRARQSRKTADLRKIVTYSQIHIT